MKQKINSYKDKLVRLNWQINGYDHSMIGKIKKIYRVQFDFLLSSGMKIKVRFEKIKGIELIK